MVIYVYMATYVQMAENYMAINGCIWLYMVKYVYMHIC